MLSNICAADDALSRGLIATVGIAAKPEPAVVMVTLVIDPAAFAVPVAAAPLAGVNVTAASTP